MQERVTLREEHVSIERRPVAPPIAAGDDAFRERTIEAIRTAAAQVGREVAIKVQYPAIVKLADGTFCVAHSVRDGDLLVVQHQLGLDDPRQRVEQK